ncbi:MAG: transposase [Chloroflexi bacterium]|nr:transposase [Chloroflexota bacterium]
MVDLSVLRSLDVEGVADPAARALIRVLLGLIEQLAAENAALRAENQHLKDELARLKGQPPRPTSRPQSGPPGAGTNRDVSSEQPRREPRTWHKAAKLPALTITRTERLRVDPTTLPADAVFKDLERVVVQDLVIQVETVCFEKEVWYSPGERRSYRAALPAGYSGQFGPGLKSLALALHFGANVTEAKLHELFAQVGVRVSTGWQSDLLSGDAAAFGAEAQAVERAGLKSSPWHHLDDTATRVDGQNEHCQVLGNGLYTAYHTTQRKDRLSVLDALQGGRSPDERTYRWDATAEAYLIWWGLSAAARQRLGSLPRDQALDAATFDQWEHGQTAWLGPQQRARIREGLAIAAYHAQTDWPVVACLVCDDAPQFQQVTAELALCWVHEGRHYAKLSPYVPQHQARLDAFRERFWQYYQELLAYKQQPTAAERARLEAAFDVLFTAETGYAALDARIALTRQKKADLLRVLAHPELPLHNNPAELAARRRVRKRDASFGPRSAAGRWAWDTYQTLAATAQQLGVPFLRYLHDRLTGAGQIPHLADLLTARAATLNFGASWAVP